PQYGSLNARNEFFLVPVFLCAGLLGESALFLLLDPAFMCGCGDASLDTTSLGSESPPHQFNESFDRIRTIHFLTSGALRNDSQLAFLVDPRCQLPGNPAFLVVGKRR